MCSYTPGLVCQGEPVGPVEGVATSIAESDGELYSSLGD